MNSSFFRKTILLALCSSVGSGGAAAQEQILLKTGVLRPVAGSREAAATPGKAELRLVQLTGPTQDEWLDELKASGAQIIAYVPNHSYVVWGDATRLGQHRGDFIRWQGAYRPEYRIDPKLDRSRPGSVDVTVQVAEVPGAEETVRQVKALASAIVHESSTAGFRNLRLTVPAARLNEIASQPAVFWVERRGRRVRLGEVQAQITAGALSGSQPTGPGYLSFLASKGFNGSQFGSFYVEVADDALTLKGAAGHPDLPASRVAFEQNPSNQGGQDPGHGFLNAHIVGGFNDGSGAEFEDSGSFNYGLGIAPFARVGVTTIFGNTFVTPTDWEPAAYAQGARISSNSWGIDGAFEYNVDAQEADTLVRDSQPQVAGNQELIFVLAAGNDGPGAGTVSAPGTAKNGITVGASESVRALPPDDGCVTAQDADNARDLAAVSSRGPVDAAGGDGRFKPDLVAPGTKIVHGIPQANYSGDGICTRIFPTDGTLYGIASGTSQSCPAVAGAAALLYQDFLNKGRGAPSPAMVKAYLMSSAVPLDGAGITTSTLPSSEQGMGRLDLGRAFDGESRLLRDQDHVLQGSGEVFAIQAQLVDFGKPVSISLAWTDAPGAPAAAAPLVNDLDLEVIPAGRAGADAAPGWRGAVDSKNNFETVSLTAGQATNGILVRVVATNIAGDGVPGNADPTDQDFALVLYNLGTAPAGPVPAPGGLVVAALGLLLALAAGRATRAAASGASGHQPNR